MSSKSIYFKILIFIFSYYLAGVAKKKEEEEVNSGPRVCM